MDAHDTAAGREARKAIALVAQLWRDRTGVVSPQVQDAETPRSITPSSIGFATAMSSKDTITELLNVRTLGALKGLEEDQWFDTKRAAGYNLATGAGRFELAKDVSTGVD